MWRYLIPHFAPDHRIVHWHYRGHGRSSPPPDDARVGLDDHVADLDAVVRRARVRRGVLVGHSLGVLLAIEYARRFPERVDALVLVCGSPGRLLDTFHGRPFLRGLLPEIVRAIDRRPDLARSLWTNLPIPLGIAVAKIAREVNPRLILDDDLVRYLEHMRRVDIALFVRMLLAFSDASAEDFLPSIRVPVLVFAGERDTFTPAVRAREMAAAIPGAELCVVPGGTHAAPVEQPELVNLRLEKFLRERVGARAAAREPRL